MSEDVKLEVIRTTQDSLSKYIKKPPLTEKLLRKPPFRYLHDITTAVMRETGYLKGLYSPDELNPENIKDREAKIAFLEKLIAAVNLSTGVTVSARPNKIVAGLDVAKTNELLQTIAKALEKNVDSSQAVEQILNNKKGSNQQASTKKESSKAKVNKEGKPAETRMREPRTSELLKKKSKDGKNKIVNKPESRKEKRASKEVLQTKTDKVPVIEEALVGENKNNAEHQQGNTLETQAEEVEPSVITLSQATLPSPSLPPKQPPSSPDHGHEQRKARSKQSENAETVQPHSDIKSNFKIEEEIKPLEEELKRPHSARAVHRRKAGIRKPTSEVENNDSDEAVLPKTSAPEIKDPPPPEKQNSQFAPSEAKETKRPRTAVRPASARPGAPRVRDRGTVLLSQKDNKIASEPVNVIVDSKELPKDDDETLVKVEASTSLTDAVVEQVVGDESQLLTGDQGHLVSQILETQKELADPTTSLETTSKFDIQRDRAVGKENTYKEVQKLQTAIQALTQAANPLGKLIDYLQEDVDSMQIELESWVTMNRDLAQQLYAEERLTEQSIEPLARQLEDINQLIEEQLEETSVVKAAIIRNDERLTRLLQSGSSHRTS